MNNHRPQKGHIGRGNAIDSGPYDVFYENMDEVWPSKPGRMVIAATELAANGRALDAGCGDGKNAIYLTSRGWHVDAFDISVKAEAACHRRCMAAQTTNCNVFRADARTIELSGQVYDLIVAYGLYHCLSDLGLAQAHRRLSDSLRVNGLFAIATFNDTMPLPKGHSTPGLVLRPKNHIFMLFEKWEVVSHQFGIIKEYHLPVIGEHEHALTWALLRKLHP